MKMNGIVCVVWDTKDKWIELDGCGARNKVVILESRKATRKVKKFDLPRTNAQTVQQVQVP